MVALVALWLPNTSRAQLRIDTSITIPPRDTIWGFCEILSLHNRNIGLELFPAMMIKHLRKKDIYILVNSFTEEGDPFIKKLDLSKYYNFVSRKDLYDLD